MAFSKISAFERKLKGEAGNPYVVLSSSEDSDVVSKRLRFEPQSDEDKEVCIPVGERTLLKQPGDGHCLIHSVRECLRHSNVRVVPSCEGLLQMVTNEVSSNLPFYSNWTNEGSDIQEDLKRYVEDRAYGTDSSDIVVNALANSLCVTIRILELGPTGIEYALHTLPQTPGRRTERPRAVIDVLKSGEHYDALVPKNATQSEKVWQRVYEKGRAAAQKKAPGTQTSHHPVKLKNRFSALDTTSDLDDDDIDDIDDFEPQRASYSTPKKKKNMKPHVPQTCKNAIIVLESTTEESDEQPAERPMKTSSFSSIDEGGYASLQGYESPEGYESPDEAIQYYNGDPKLPYLCKSHKPVWKSQQLADLLVVRKSGRICTARPLAPQENCSFLIDTSRLDDKDDWKSDDHGSWRNCGSSGRVVMLTDTKVESSSMLPRSKKRRPSLGPNQYIFQTTYYRHMKYPDFKRSSIVAIDNRDNQLDFIILQYYFVGKVHPISPKKHGNSKVNKQFLPTTASTKKRLHQKASGSIRGPLSIFDQVSQDVGDVQSSYAASDVPRGIDQIKYLRKTLRKKRAKDEISELIDKAHSLPNNLFSLQLTPSLRFVITTNQTMSNVAEFCTRQNNCTPFCVDTTYGIGDFFVTTTSYKNLKLLNASNNEHPSFPGPALFHMEQDAPVFGYFAQTMIGIKDDLKYILFLGSDRDKALTNGMNKYLLVATNLYCKKHLEDDIKRKFSKLPHINNNIRSTILVDIFGSESAQVKGLVDAESEQEFADQCYTCCNKWDKLERSCGDSVIPQFSHYFKTFIANDMKEGMLVSKRRSAGLGDDFFYNNLTESINFRFKNKLKEHKSVSVLSGRPPNKVSLPVAVDVYMSLLEEYNRNAQRAMINVGPYRLARRFAHFCIPMNEWAQLPTEERNKKIKKFNEARLPESSDETVSSYRNNVSTQQRESAADNLFKSNGVFVSHNEQSNYLFDFSETGLSENYRVDWRGAASILCDKATIKSPWASNSYIVRSDSNPGQTHAVSFSIANHSIKCDCPRFKFHAICKHAISIAHTEGFLLNFLRKHSPNLSRQMQDTVPDRVGQKKSERGKRLRKAPSHRDIEDFNGPHLGSSSPEDEKIRVVFLSTTRARTCYGCGGSIRSKDDVSMRLVPPVPYDIVLTRKERRVFKERGSNKIRIAKTDENVYYHPKRICLLEKVSNVSPGMFMIDVNVETNLTESHKNLLNGQFRLGIR